MLPEWFVRCVWSELPNTEIIVPPIGRISYRISHYHHSYDDIQLFCLFVPPPVSSFHLWVDTFFSCIEFLCWSIWHTLPERRLLHEDLSALNRIAAKQTCGITLMMVVWSGKLIVTHFAWIPTCDAHRVWQFIHPFKWCVGRSEVADGCHCRVPEKLVDNHSAQVVLDAQLH